MSLQDAALRDAAQRIEALPSRASAWTSDLSALMRRMWAEANVQRAMLQSVTDEDDI